MLAAIQFSRWGALVAGKGHAGDPAAPGAVRPDHRAGARAARHHPARRHGRRRHRHVDHPLPGGRPRSALPDDDPVRQLAADPLRPRLRPRGRHASAATTSPSPTPRTSTSGPMPASSRRSNGRSSSTSSRSHDPARIGINIGEAAWCAGGLSHLLHGRLAAALGPYAERLVSAEKAGVLWASTLTPSEADALPPRHRDRPLDDRRVLHRPHHHPGRHHHRRSRLALLADLARPRPRRRVPPLLPHPPRPRAAAGRRRPARAT